MTKVLVFIRFRLKAIENERAGFRAKIVVLRPEGVYTYVERKETAIE